MNQKARIAELEKQLSQARKLGRTKREPASGVGGSIQRLREHRGIGLRELADKAKISAGMMTRLETKSSMTLRTLDSVASAFGLKTSEFLDWHERNEKKATA